MTTYTVSVAPTVATYGFTYTATTSESYTRNVGGDQTELTYRLSSISNKTTNIFSNANTEESTNLTRTYEDAFSIQGILENKSTISSVFSTRATLSWNGAYTTAATTRATTTENTNTPQSGENIESVSATSFTQSGSKTTSTTATTLSQSTYTSQSNVSTVTGSLSGEILTTASTQTTVKTTASETYQTNRVTTTTQSESVTFWRTNSGESGNRGTYQSATVVCLDTNEVAYSLTSAASSLHFISEIASRQSGQTVFTFYPAIETASGVVANSTDSSVSEFSLTYSASSVMQTTITVGSSIPRRLPAQTQTRLWTTVTTSQDAFTYSSFSYTGDTTTTHVYSQTLVAAEFNGVEYQEPRPYLTTVATSRPVEITGSGSTATTIVSEDGPVSETTESASAYAESISWQRSETAGAKLMQYTFDDGQTTQLQAVGASYKEAWAAPSAADSAALIVGASGLTVSGPVALTANGARTADVILGSWSYVSAASSITASADAVGISATTRTNTSEAAQTTSGSWTTQNAPVIVATWFPPKRINPGGKGATGGGLSVTKDGMTYLTSRAGSSGTISFSRPTASQQATNAQRTAFSLPILASRGDSRYFTTARNFTALPVDPVGALP